MLGSAWGEAAAERKPKKPPVGQNPGLMAGCTTTGGTAGQTEG